MTLLSGTPQEHLERPKHKGLIAPGRSEQLQGVFTREVDCGPAQMFLTRGPSSTVTAPSAPQCPGPEGGSVGWCGWRPPEGFMG